MASEEARPRGGSTSVGGGDGTCTVDADCDSGSFCGCATIGVVGVTEGTALSGALTLDAPAGLASGDVLITGIAVRPDNAMATAPTGWTPIRIDTSADGITENLYSYYRVVETGEPPSHTWTFSGSHTGAVGGIIAFRGADPTAPIEADDGQSTNGSTSFGGLAIDAPSLSISVPESMIVSLYAVTSSSQWQPPTTMSEAVDLSTLVGSTSGETLLMSYGPQAMAGDTGVRTAIVASHDGGTAVSQTMVLRPLCAADRCTPRQSDGWTCTADRQCRSGMCVHNHCCDGVCSDACDACDVVGSRGTCSPATAGSQGSPDCAPYACNGILTDCPSSCTSHEECGGGFFCNGSAGCVPVRNDGQTCFADLQCVSGKCVDGYCCNGDCSGSCNACDRPGNEGTCSPLPTGASGSPTCTPYVCGGVSSSCPTSCFVSADCAAGFTCAGGSCI